jgi:site-specific DNA-methyltransferase (adenine-specific)
VSKWPEWKSPDGSIWLINADYRNVLPLLGHVDAIVTDPPYALTANKKGGSGVASVNAETPYGRSMIGTGNGSGGFMGMAWDSKLPSVEDFEVCFHALKPGGYMLAFAATRTQHRMAVNIEDAGFEIRDMIAWLYGSGFPKSLDVSKAIDKALGAKPIDMGQSPNWRESKRDREKSGSMEVRGENAGRITAPATDDARQWQGWGTAIKPALEPITVARKPLIGTVAENVLQYGTGAMNIDGCRIELNGDYKCKANGRPSQTGLPDNYDPENANQPDTIGRWPANVIHDGSKEVIELFPSEAGATGQVTKRNADKFRNSYGEFKGTTEDAPFYNDTGSAARFFYCAKASREERGEGNIHPTVKPIDLMMWLCRLVTPPNGIVVDPYMGSGSTAKACHRLGMKFIGFEREKHYFDICVNRMKEELSRVPLFDLPQERA